MPVGKRFRARKSHSPKSSSWHSPAGRLHRTRFTRSLTPMVRPRIRRAPWWRVKACLFRMKWRSMSQKLVDLNPDLRRLRDVGYNVDVWEREGYLVVRDVPYVT